VRQDLAEIRAADEAVSVKVREAWCSRTRAPSADRESDVLTVDEPVARSVAGALRRALSPELVAAVVGPCSADIHALTAEEGSSNANRTRIDPDPTHRRTRMAPSSPRSGLAKATPVPKSPRHRSRSPCLPTGCSPAPQALQLTEWHRPARPDSTAEHSSATERVPSSTRRRPPRRPC
jgi:hypothetical protein